MFRVGVARRRSELLDGDGNVVDHVVNTDRRHRFALVLILLVGRTRDLILTLTAKSDRQRQVQQHARVRTNVQDSCTHFSMI